MSGTSSRSITVKMVAKDVRTEGEDTVTVITLQPQFPEASLDSTTVKFIQTREATEDGIAVLPYGGVIFNTRVMTTEDAILAPLLVEIKGVNFRNNDGVRASQNVGTEYVLTEVSSGGGGGDGDVHS